MEFMGMSMRDWFAGQALAGLLGDPDTAPGEGDWSGNKKEFFRELAFSAYGFADAMLAERSKS